MQRTGSAKIDALSRQELLLKTQSAQLSLHLAVLLFGLSGLFGKWLSIDPMVIVFGRTAVAALAIFIVLKLISSSLAVSSTKSLLLMVISGVVLALHWLTFFHSIQVSTVAIALVGFSAFPVFVTFIEPVLTGQSIRRVDILSALLVTIGLVFVAPSFDLNDTATVGLLWAVLSGALFAVLTLMNRCLVEEHPVMQLSFYQHVCAALAVLPFVVVAGVVPVTSDWGLLIVLGLVCTALPHMLFIQSLTVLKAQLASIVAGLEPVYGIFFAAILLGEIPSLSTLTGAVIVFAAVILAVRAHAGEATS